MKRIFVLEDSEIRINCFKKVLSDYNLTIVKTANEAIDILSKDLNFDVLFLDHDLGDRIWVSTKDENTGSTVAKFLSDKDIKGQIVIHSYNPVGARNMLQLLPKAVYIPFSEGLLSNIKRQLK